MQGVFAVFLLHRGFGVLGLFAGLSRKLFNNSVIVALRLQLHASLLAFDALNLDLVVQKLVLG